MLTFVLQDWQILIFKGLLPMFVVSHPVQPSNYAKVLREELEAFNSLLKDAALLRYRPEILPCQPELRNDTSSYGVKSDE